MLGERPLQRRQLAVVAGEPFDGGDRGPVGLDGEQAAALDRVAVELHGAGAAVAGVAADVRAGEIEVVAQEVDEQARGGNLALVGRAVDLDRDRPAPWRWLTRLPLSLALCRLAGRRAPPRPRRGGGGSRRSRARRTAGRATRQTGCRGAHGLLGESPPARRSSIAVARTGTAETQPIATRTPSGETVAAALTMYVPWAPSVTPSIASPVPGRRRHRDLRQQLALPDGGQVDAEEELVGRHRPLAAGALDRERRAEGGEQRREVVRRVVDADVAADRAAVARVGDRAPGRGHGHRRTRRMAAPRPRTSDQLGVRDHGAELEHRSGRPRTRSCATRRDRPGRRARRARLPAPSSR